MKHFKLDLLTQENTVIYCNTKKKAKRLLKFAKRMGLIEKYNALLTWYGYKDDTKYLQFFDPIKNKLLEVEKY